MKDNFKKLLSENIKSDEKIVDAFIKKAFKPGRFTESEMQKEQLAKLGIRSPVGARQLGYKMYQLPHTSDTSKWTYTRDRQYGICTVKLGGGINITWLNSEEAEAIIRVGKDVKLNKGR